MRCGSWKPLVTSCVSNTEYVIYEQPQPRQPETPGPDTVSPDTEKPAELNIEKPNTQKQKTHGASTDSIPFRETAAAQLPERKGRDAISVSEIENYRELILENIEYDYLCREFLTYWEDLNEIVELMVETVCAKRETTRIAGSDFSHEVVRSWFLKLDSEHNFGARQFNFTDKCSKNSKMPGARMYASASGVLFFMFFIGWFGIYLSNYKIRCCPKFPAMTISSTICLSRQ